VLPEDLVASIEDLGYDLSVRSNRAHLIDSARANGEEEIAWCVDKVNVRVENSPIENPGALLHHMISDGLFLDERRRLEEERYL
jgi:hypothetical protein